MPSADLNWSKNFKPKVCSLPEMFPLKMFVEYGSWLLLVCCKNAALVF